HEVIEPGMFEQREHVSHVAEPILLAGLLFDRQALRPLAPRYFRLPFAVAAVEGQNACAAGEAQYIAEIVGLVAVERDTRPYAQGGVDKQAGLAEIELGHSLIFLNRVRF